MWLMVVLGNDFDVDVFCLVWIFYYEMFLKFCFDIKFGVVEIFDLLDWFEIFCVIVIFLLCDKVDFKIGIFDIIYCFYVIVVQGDYLKGKFELDLFLMVVNCFGVDFVICFVLEDSYNGICLVYVVGMMVVMVLDFFDLSDEICFFCIVVVYDLYEVVVMIEKV